MKNLFRLSLSVPVFIFGVTISLILTGCSIKEPTKPPKEVLKEAFENFKNVNAADYEVLLSGKMEAPSGQSQFDFTIEGLFNFETPEASAKVKGNLKTSESEAGDFEFELRLDKNALYSLLSEVPAGTENLPTDFVQAFLGRWWKITLPADYFDVTNLAFWREEAEIGNLSEDEKRMKELFEGTEFFKEVNYLGTEKIMGDETYHYDAVLDKEEVKNFVAEAAKFASERITEEDLQSFSNALLASDLNVEIWVGAEDMTLHKISGSMELDAKEEGKADVDFTVSFGDLNENLSIEIPADAQEFDPFSYLNLLQNSDAQLPSN